MARMAWMSWFGGLVSGFGSIPARVTIDAASSLIWRVIPSRLSVGRE